MRFTKTLKYNLKRALPILTIAGAGLMSSCQDEPDVPTRDVELKFFSGYVEEVTPENIKAHLQDKYVRHIYLTIANGGYFYHYSTGNLTDLRRFIEDRINIDPDRISGRGPVNCRPGYILKEDSIALVMYGYKVNQK